MDDKRDLLNSVKGGIAQTLVEKLFSRSDFKVRISGSPWKYITIDTSTDYEPVKHHGDEPDLAISYSGSPWEFLEVKYRWDRILDYAKEKDLRSQCREWEIQKSLYVIVVNKKIRPYFNVLSSPFFDEDNKVFLSMTPLLEMKRWFIDPYIYYLYENLIEAGKIFPAE